MSKQRRLLFLVPPQQLGCRLEQMSSNPPWQITGMLCSFWGVLGPSHPGEEDGEASVGLLGHPLLYGVLLRCLTRRKTPLSHHFWCFYNLYHHFLLLSSSMAHSDMGQVEQTGKSPVERLSKLGGRRGAHTGKGSPCWHSKSV